MDDLRLSQERRFNDARTTVNSRGSSMPPDPPIASLTPSALDFCPPPKTTTLNTPLLTTGNLNLNNNNLIMNLKTAEKEQELFKVT